MDKDYLNKIKEAEEQADEILHKASIEAEKIKEDSLKEIEKHNTELEEQLDLMVKNIIDEAVKKAEKEAEEINNDIDEECAKINAQADNNMDKAVNYVVERIVNGRWQ